MKNRTLLKRPSLTGAPTTSPQTLFLFAMFLLSGYRQERSVASAFRPAVVLNDKLRQNRSNNHRPAVLSIVKIPLSQRRQYAVCDSTTRLFLSTPPGGNNNDGLFIDVDPDDEDGDEELNDNGITDALDEIIFVVDPTATESELEEEDDDDEDDDEQEEDPYTKVAASEFQDDDNKKDTRRENDIGALTFLGEDKLETTMMDWGGALSTLRERVDDVESGKAQNPSHVLFRMMSSQTPNQIIGQFVSNADPMVVQAMSGAVGSLLGGLSNPNMGVETLVKASGEKLGSLCFQLQMTGAKKEEEATMVL